MVKQIEGTRPHYLLFVQTAAPDNPGRWHFTLKQVDGTTQFHVTDVEPDVTGERLELLTIVRALESLDQPSRVTLASYSDKFRQGVQYNILDWKANNWLWEFFGYMVPVKNADLWQRIEHLLNVHAVECRHRRFDNPHNVLTGPKFRQLKSNNRNPQVIAETWLKYASRIIPQTLRHGLAMAVHIVWQKILQLKPSSSF